jgi:hypothetical protein
MNLAPARIAMLLVLVVVEACLLFAAFSDSHIDKPAHRSAWYEWRQHPTPQTEAAWLSEKRKIRAEQVIMEAAIWLMIVGTGTGIFYVVSRKRDRI